MTASVRILGIDPGSRITGFGVIDVSGSKSAHVDSGCIRIGTGQVTDRLRCLYESLAEVIRETAPDEVAIEQVFVSRNVDSALKLGQARGVAICVAALADLPVAEYAATQIKQAIVGNGRAEKSQVQHMVRVLLGLAGQVQADAGDALGVALCHAHMRATRNRLASLGAGEGQR